MGARIYRSAVATKSVQSAREPSAAQSRAEPAPRFSQLHEDTHAGSLVAFNFT